LATARSGIERLEKRALLSAFVVNSFLDAVDMGAFEFETTTTSSGTVVLPSGGGSYVVRGDAGDIVLQHEDGIELFRRDRTIFEFLIVVGSTGADTLSVDFSGDGGVPSLGLSFEDGFGDLVSGDLLRLTGGSANMIVQTATNPLSGEVTVDGLSIHYSKIEQIRDELDTTHRVYHSREATASRITLDGGDVPNDGVSRLSLGESGARIEFFDPSGSLTIESGDGNDVITLGELDLGFAAGVTIRGEAGNDRIDASLLTHAVTLIGGDGHDTLLGGRMADSLDGGAGKDLLNGRAGNDTLMGGTANDRLFGGRGSDRLDGGRGHDLLKGQGTRFDTLSGGPGNDTLNGGPGIDWLEETGDVDFRLTGSTLSGLGNDRLAGIERAHLTGGPSDNHLDARSFRWPVTLMGADGQDTLRGGRGGDDELRGGFGHDRLLGGSGRDSLDGGHGDDRLRGQGGGDLLLGQGGGDLLDGAAGDDTLLGGPGDDSLFGSQSEIDEAFTFVPDWFADG
jgi:Ca2+-binding RTX toxin-like protein